MVNSGLSNAIIGAQSAVDVLTPPTPPTNTPAGSKPVRLIDRRHPEHTRLSPVWRQLTLLYEGGHNLRENCQEFLRKRPKEAPTVYSARCEMFEYKPHLPTALDYYSSELFEEDPHLQAVTTDGKGGSQPVSNDDPKRQFYDRFIAECDRGGTSLVDFFRQVFHNVLLYRSAFVLVDLPSFDAGDYLTKAEQLADGVFDPFLGVFAPASVINWKEDKYGNLEWCVIKKVNLIQQFGDATTKIDTRWYYYDQQQFQVWQRISDPTETVTPDDAMAELINSGNHKLAAQKKTPVLKLQVSGGLWLANRALLAAMAHLNADNALAWALFMGALAMPVIKTDDSFKIDSSETGFIKLPLGSEYGWSEPTGHSFKHLADRIDNLKEDIFRCFYLIHQGRSGRATPTAQSGVSKQMDMMPSKDMLKMFGDLLRAFIIKVMVMVSQFRGDNFQWEVTGFSFKDDLSEAEVQMFTEFLALDIPSETLNKVIWKLLAQRAAGNTSELILNQINSEIMQAKSKQDLQLDKMTKEGTVQAKLTAMEQNTKDVGMDAGEQTD